jgi:hypothetical protein
MTTRSPVTLSLLLFLAGLILQVPAATGQTFPVAVGVELDPELRERIAQSAKDSALAPWQRDVMLRMADPSQPGVAPSAPRADRSSAESLASSTDDGEWFALAPPSEREDPVAIYDPVRDRMLVFGGNDISFPNRTEVWAFGFTPQPKWSLLAVTGTPAPGRYGHSVIYDPVRDRMIVFGGFTGGGRANDVWTLSLSGTPAWAELAPSGGPPSERREHTAIYDPVRDRMLVYGGDDINGSLTNMWALSLSGDPEWEFVFGTGGPPAPRHDHTAIYDPVRDRMVVFGGYNPSIGHLNDTWALSLAGSPAWSLLAPSGTPPAARSGAAATYDPVRDRMVVFAGLSTSGRENDVRALSLSGTPAWSALVPAGGPPPQRFNHTMIYDPVRDHLVAFGGNATGRFLNDVWRMSLPGSPAWAELTPAGGPPSGRMGAMAAYDPVRERMLVFGGIGVAGITSDVWALSLTGELSWTELAPTGTPPDGRSMGAVVYDALRDRLVLFGGASGGTYYDEVWSLTLSETPAWTPLSPTGTPPIGRHLFTAIYDPARDRIVIFGGNDWSGLHGDVWALSLGASHWTELTPAGTSPTPRLGSVGIYDPVRDRMIVVGGWDGSFQNDVWAFGFSTGLWTELSPTGSAADLFAYGTGIYDPVRDRMVIFGGTAVSGRSNETWALSLGGTPNWAPLEPAAPPPGEMYLQSAIYDPVGDRMVVFGGSNDSSFRRDTWMLDWTHATESVSPVGRDLARLFALAPPRPNPSRSETIVEFELARPSRIAIDIFDAQGRSVRRIAEGWFTAGRHARAWPGDDELGHAVSAGVYFIRMRADGIDDGVEATRRVVRMR